MAGPLPPVPNCIKASINWQLDVNLGAMSNLHFLYTGGHPSGSDCAGLAADIQAAAVTEFKPLIPSIVKLGLVTVTDIDSTSGAQGTGGSITAGTRTGSSNDAASSVVMQHNIARRYRGGKPRSYAPFGVNADYNTMGTWQPTFLNTCASNWNAFITTCLAASVGTTVLAQYVNVSYFSGKALRPTPHTDPIVTTTARTRVGSQRRRLKTA